MEGAGLVTSGIGIVLLIIGIIIISIIIIAVIVQKNKRLPAHHQILYEAILNSKIARFDNFVDGSISFSWENGKLLYNCFLDNSQQSFLDGEINCDYNKIKSEVDFESIYNKFEKALKDAIERANKSSPSSRRIY